MALRAVAHCARYVGNSRNGDRGRWRLRVAHRRKKYMFLGSDNGGHTAAVLYSLLATAKRHGLDSFA